MKTIYKKPDSKRLLDEAYDKTLQAWEVSHEIIWVSTRFGRTHIIAAGPADGEPLMLLHGYAFSSAMWIDNIKDLIAHYRVYAVDFVGDINKSEATRPIQTKQEVTQWFRDVLDGLGIRKTHVMGMSYGGFLALTLAGQLPERIVKLVSISPGASLQRQSLAFFMRCLAAGVFPSTKRLNRLMDYMSVPGNTINAAVKRQFVVAMQTCIPRVKLFAGYLEDAELRAIACPVMVLIGDHEVQYDARLAIDRAERLIPRVQTALIENSGHGLTMEQPYVVDRYVLDFLADNNSRAAVSAAAEGGIHA